MLTQLSIIIALIAAIAVGSSAAVAPTSTSSKGINPVQHSE